MATATFRKKVAAAVGLCAMKLLSDYAVAWDSGRSSPRSHNRPCRPCRELSPCDAWACRTWGRLCRGGNEGRQLICQSGMSCTHHITGAGLTFGHIIRNLLRALGERIIRKADSVAKASNSVFAAYERGFVIRYCAA